MAQRATLFAHPVQIVWRRVPAGRERVIRTQPARSSDIGAGLVAYLAPTLPISLQPWWAAPSQVSPVSPAETSPCSERSSVEPARTIVTRGEALTTLRRVSVQVPDGVAPVGFHPCPNQRMIRLAPNSVLSVAMSADGPSMVPTGAWPLTKVTATLATMSWPNSR